MCDAFLRGQNRFVRHLRQSDTPVARVPRGPRRAVLLPVLLSLVLALAAVTGIVAVFRPGASGVEQSRAGARPAGTLNAADVLASPSAPARPRARFGVFVGTDAAAAAQFQSWLGRPVQDVADFSARDTWSDIANPRFLLQEWRGTRRRLIYAVPMLPNALAPAKEAAMRQGATGAYDTYFRALAQRLVAGGHEDAVLRIGWEFNLKSWPWGIKDHTVFVTYFRRVATAMRSVPGQRFNINWNPNNGFNPYDAVKYYPGNAFVDSIGVDAYDVDKNRYPYPRGCNAACRQKRQQIAWDEVIYGGPRGLDFWTFFADKHGKPFALPEWSMWARYDGTGGGDDPFFLAQMRYFIASPLNNVSFAAYFNRNSQDGRHELLTTFPDGAQRFRALFGR
jgi:hypothetical protein